MGILSSLLEGISGGLHFYVFVGKEPAAEIKIEGKKIIVDIKNPLLAVEFGAREFLKGGKPDGSMLKAVKDMGFSVVIRYRRFEIKL
jgi:hypothetical protein